MTAAERLDLDKLRERLDEDVAEWIYRTRLADDLQALARDAERSKWEVLAELHRITNSVKAAYPDQADEAIALISDALRRMR